MVRTVVDTVFIIVTLVYIMLAKLITDSCTDGEYIIALMVNYGLCRYLFLSNSKLLESEINE